MHYTSPIINSTGSDELRKMVTDRKIPDHEDYKNQHRIESLVMLDHPQLDDLEWMIEKLAESTQPGKTQKTKLKPISTTGAILFTTSSVPLPQTNG